MDGQAPELRVWHGTLGGQESRCLRRLMPAQAVCLRSPSHHPLTPGLLIPTCPSNSPYSGCSALKENMGHHLVNVKALTNSSGPRASFLRKCSLKLFHVLASSPHHAAQFWERSNSSPRTEGRRTRGCLSHPECNCDTQGPYSELLPVFRHFLILWIGVDDRDL